MQTEQPVKDFGEVWIDNPNFGVSIAALLIICIIALLGYLIKNVVGTVIKKLDGLKEEVIELKDKISPITTYINIQLKGTINGDYDEE